MNSTWSHYRHDGMTAWRLGWGWRVGKDLLLLQFSYNSTLPWVAPSLKRMHTCGSIALSLSLSLFFLFHVRGQADEYVQLQWMHLLLYNFGIRDLCVKFSRRLAFLNAPNLFHGIFCLQRYTNLNFGNFLSVMLVLFTEGKSHAMQSFVEPEHCAETIKTLPRSYPAKETIPQSFFLLR
jgi:hypothetical protein